MPKNRDFTAPPKNLRKSIDRKKKYYEIFYYDSIKSTTPAQQTSNKSSGKRLSSNKMYNEEITPKDLIFEWIEKGGDINNPQEALLLADMYKVKHNNLQKTLDVIKDIISGGTTPNTKATHEYYKLVLDGAKINLAELSKKHPDSSRVGIHSMIKNRKKYYDFLFQKSSTESGTRDNQFLNTDTQPRATTSLNDWHRQIAPAQTSQVVPETSSTSLRAASLPDPLVALPTLSPKAQDARPVEIHPDADNHSTPASSDNSYIDTDHPLFPLSPGQDTSPRTPEPHSGRDTPPILHAGDTPMDVDLLPDYDPSPLVKQEQPVSPDSPSAHEPEQVNLDDIGNDIADQNPLIKPEINLPTESPHPVEPVVQASPEPAESEAPVKIEEPRLKHTINNAAPVLQNENGEDVLREVLQQESKLRRPADLQTLVERLKSKFPDNFEADMLKTFAQLEGGTPAQHARETQAEITQQAKNLLTMSNEERAAHMESLMTVVQTPEKGRGVVAKRDIEAFEVLGPYTGKWLDSAGQKREETAIGESKLNAYAFNLPNKNAIISAFGDGHGNLTTLLNDADNPVDNNVSHIWLGRNLVFLVAKKPIPQGTQLLLDYGNTYDRSGWESHPIKVEPEDQ